MSDEIVIINITPDPSINISAVDSNELVDISAIDNSESISLNPLTLNQGLINHSVTHQKNGSDELLHNLLGGLNGGQSGQYYHMTQNQYDNNVYRYDLPVYQTGVQTISGIKTFTDKTLVSGLKFQVLTGNQVPVHEQGLMFYDDANHTINLYVDNPDVTLQLGQENWVRVKNTLNAPILDGDLVYIAGGVGANPYVQLAIAGGENTSAATLGMATHDIGNNEFGYITTFGLVNNINTNGYNVGDTLYLSPTQSGKYTNVKPQAPQHMVRVGTVIRANTNNGVVFVNIQNGLEIEELHDVRIVNKQNKQALLYDSTSGLWLNRPINTGDISGLYDFVINTESEFMTEAEADIRYINLVSNQNISGIKNFYTRPLVNGTGVMLSGEVDPLPTTIVYQTGNQIISGEKYFLNDVGIGTITPTEKLDVNGNIVGNMVYEFNGITKERLATQNFAIAMAIALS